VPTSHGRHGRPRDSGVHNTTTHNDLQPCLMAPLRRAARQLVVIPPMQVVLSTEVWVVELPTCGVEGGWVRLAPKDGRHRACQVARHPHTVLRFGQTKQGGSPFWPLWHAQVCVRWLGSYVALGRDTWAINIMPYVRPRAACCCCYSSTDRQFAYLSGSWYTPGPAVDYWKDGRRTTRIAESEATGPNGD
jgi:hypothetical protein